MVTHHPPCGSSKKWPGGRLLIAARVIEIDGEGNTLGQAAPDKVRNDCPTISISGFMEFDIDDVDDLVSGGTFEAVVIHEIGHIIGIGYVQPGVYVTRKRNF